MYKYENKLVNRLKHHKKSLPTICRKHFIRCQIKFAKEKKNKKIFNANSFKLTTVIKRTTLTNQIFHTLRLVSEHAKVIVCNGLYHVFHCSVHLKVNKFFFFLVGSIGFVNVFQNADFGIISLPKVLER